MPFSFRETEQPALVVGQDGILRAGWQPAPAGLFTGGPDGLTTRRRLPTCPTTSAEYPLLGKLSGIGHSCLPRPHSSGRLPGMVESASRGVGTRQTESLLPHTFPAGDVLHLLWGGQSCPQPPFRRLFGDVSEPSGAKAG